MKFAYTIVYVPDVEASLAFFESAFGLSRRFIAPGGDYGELDTGATALAFAQHETARGNLGQDYLAADTSGLPLGVEIGLSALEAPPGLEQRFQISGEEPPPRRFANAVANLGRLGESFVRKHRRKPAGLQGVIGRDGRLRFEGILRMRTERRGKCPKLFR